MNVFDFTEIHRLKEALKASTKKNETYHKKILELEESVLDAEIRLEELQEKYVSIIDIEKEIEAKNEEIETINAKIKKILEAFRNLDDRYKRSLVTFSNLKKEINSLNNDLNFIDYGIYAPIFDYEDSEIYKSEITKVVQKQKELVKKDQATYCPTSWSVNGKLNEGKVMIKKEKQLMIRAFNGECNALISKVKWNNYISISKRIDNIFNKINALGSSSHIIISKAYFDLKKEQLILTHEHNLKKYKAKEEERVIREERREEEKAIREIEREQRKAEQEEFRYLRALNKVKKEIEDATGVKFEQLSQKIKFLEAELRIAQESKERAFSMAQQTKRGYVYIISNIGSFGENIYKIGMTRRIDPIDRIRELSNASVPFRYDIHAMLFSEDAPSLETLLHNAFEEKKVNKVNGRKEFFKVSLEEIEQKIKESGIKTEFLKVPEARDYRETLSIIASKESLFDNSTINSIGKEYPDYLFDYDEFDE